MPVRRRRARKPVPAHDVPPFTTLPDTRIYTDAEKRKAYNDLIGSPYWHGWHWATLNLDWRVEVPGGRLSVKDYMKGDRSKLKR